MIKKIISIILLAIISMPSISFSKEIDNKNELSIKNYIQYLENNNYYDVLDKFNNLSKKEQEIFISTINNTKIIENIFDENYNDWIIKNKKIENINHFTIQSRTPGEDKISYYDKRVQFVSSVLWIEAVIIEVRWIFRSNNHEVKGIDYWTMYVKRNLLPTLNVNINSVSSFLTRDLWFLWLADKNYMMIIWVINYQLWMQNIWWITTLTRTPRVWFSANWTPIIDYYH